MVKLFYGNRVFNINGAGDDMLLQLMRLAFDQSGDDSAVGCAIDNENGLVFLSYINQPKEPKINVFPIPYSVGTCFKLVTEWLAREETWHASKLTGWDADADHDGDNSRGWRMYCDDWGHIDGMEHAIIAIKPAYLWHGK